MSKSPGQHSDEEKKKQGTQLSYRGKGQPARGGTSGTQRGFNPLIAEPSSRSFYRASCLLLPGDCCIQLISRPVGPL